MNANKARWDLTPAFISGRDCFICYASRDTICRYLEHGEKWYFSFIISIIRFILRNADKVNVFTIAIRSFVLLIVPIDGSVGGAFVLRCLAFLVAVYICLAEVCTTFT